MINKKQNLFLIKDRIHKISYEDVKFIISKALKIEKDTYNSNTLCIVFNNSVIYLGEYGTIIIASIFQEIELRITTKDLKEELIYD